MAPRYPKAAKLYAYRYKTSEGIFGENNQTIYPVTYDEAVQQLEQGLNKNYVREIVEIRVVRTFRRGQKPE